eukprot:10434.XXX_551913_551483_1 [CDS] Oithona nana genome sequencing.
MWKKRKKNDFDYWHAIQSVPTTANCVPPYFSSMLEDYRREYEEDGKLNEKQLFKACSGKYTSS